MRTSFASVGEPPEAVAALAAAAAEAARNAARHSQATLVTFIAHTSPQAAVVEVRDNESGFDPGLLLLAGWASQTRSAIG